MTIASFLHLSFHQGISESLPGGFYRVDQELVPGYELRQYVDIEARPDVSLHLPFNHSTIQPFNNVPMEQLFLSYNLKPLTLNLKRMIRPPA